MLNVYVGVGYVTLLIRHARSLKDKRQVTKSLKQRLVNQGFSVAECGDVEDLKTATLGFTWVGGDYPQVERILEAAMGLFRGEFDVVRTRSEIFNFAEENEFEDPLEEKFYP